MRCVAVLLLLAVTVSMVPDGLAAEADVILTAEYGTPPLLDPPVLSKNVPTEFRASLKIINRTGRAYRFARFRTVLPELIDAADAVVPFDHGANGSRDVTDADFPTVQPGESLPIPLRGTLTLKGNQLSWRGEDAILGFWTLGRANAPYRIRLHYRQKAATVGPIGPGLEMLDDVWTGEAATPSVPLPLRSMD
jgi:hypothetical protein